MGAEPDGCDPLDTRQCVLPYPSNAYRRDGRVAIPADGLPVNTDGVAIDPSEWNRNDGFSPGQALVLRRELLILALSDRSHVDPNGKSISAIAKIFRRVNKR